MNETKFNILEQVGLSGDDEEAERHGHTAAILQEPSARQTNSESCFPQIDSKSKETRPTPVVDIREQPSEDSYI